MKTAEGDFMIFKKNERRKLPICLALAVGGLATLGLCSLKRRTEELCSSVRSKMKKAFSSKKTETDLINMPDSE